MPAFPHLDFIQLVNGSHSPLKNAFPRQSKRSEDNLADLRKHGRDLSHQIQSVQAQWNDFILRQAESGFELSTEAQEAIPIFLQVDPNTFKADTLRAWGIDVVAEEANGFIIGVSPSSNFPQLSQRLSKMMLGTVKGVQNVAELWEIQPRGQSLHQVVAEALLDRWATLDTESECWIEVSVSIDRTNPGAYPPLNATQADLTRWDAAWAKWDAEKDRRTTPLDKIIDAYRGYIHSVYDQSDTCNYKIEVVG